MYALKLRGKLNFECQGTIATHDWERSDLFEGELSMIMKVVTFFGLLAKTGGMPFGRLQNGEGCAFDCNISSSLLVRA